MESQRLIEPRFVQFNSVAEDGETNLAFLFMVVHEDEDEHLSGFVFAHDARNTVGLIDGDNWRGMIGRGGPGKNASWSPIGEGLES